jgi:hypothetical protein
MSWYTTQAHQIHNLVVTPHLSQQGVYTMRSSSVAYTRFCWMSFSEGSSSERCALPAAPLVRTCSRPTSTSHVG